MGKLQDLYINKTREYLKQKAMDIIRKAQNTKTTDNITGAQFDSYGALIFFNGGVVYSFIADPSKNIDRQKYYIETLDNHAMGRHKGWEAMGIPDGTGTEWAKLLRNEIKSGAWGKIPEKGFALVVFNAAFYSGFQDADSQYKSPHIKRKFRIISQIVGDMQNLEKDFKGSTLRGVGININK